MTRGVCTSPSSARGQPPWAPRASPQVWALPGPAVTHTMLWLVTGSPPPAGRGLGTTRRRSRDGRGLGGRARLPPPGRAAHTGTRSRSSEGAAAPPAVAGARWAEAARGGGGLSGRPLRQAADAARAPPSWSSPSPLLRPARPHAWGAPLAAPPAAHVQGVPLWLVPGTPRPRSPPAGDRQHRTPRVLWPWADFWHFPVR